VSRPTNNCRKTRATKHATDGVPAPVGWGESPNPIDRGLHHILVRLTPAHGNGLGCFPDHAGYFWDSTRGHSYVNVRESKHLSTVYRFVNKHRGPLNVTLYHAFIALRRRLIICSVLAQVGCFLESIMRASASCSKAPWTRCR
jgi:hypothetical protein